MCKMCTEVQKNVQLFYTGQQISCIFGKILHMLHTATSTREETSSSLSGRRSLELSVCRQALQELQIPWCLVQLTSISSSSINQFKWRATDRGLQHTRGYRLGHMQQHACHRQCDNGGRDAIIQKPIGDSSDIRHYDHRYLSGILSKEGYQQKRCNKL